jgi:hypothetical protein
VSGKDGSTKTEEDIMDNLAQEYADTIASEIADRFDDFVACVMEVHTIVNSEGRVCGTKLLRTCGRQTCWVDTYDQMIYCLMGGNIGVARINGNVCADLDSIFVEYDAH